MKHRITISLVFIFILGVSSISSCQRRNIVCPPIEGTPLPRPVLEDLIRLPAPDSQTEPITVEISGKMITVDKLVDGPLCNDTWSGTVYVGCAAVVGVSKMDAEKNPLFLKDCELNIEPGTIVYVAAHNDAAYYKGCSCHTGEDLLP